MAEEHGSSKSDAGRKPSGRRTKKIAKIQPGDDAKFEAFLTKQFAELKNELRKYPVPGEKKSGQVIPFSPRINSWAKRNTKWKYGIAAAVIVAVAVPMVLQVNRQRAEFAHSASTPALEQRLKNDKTLQDRISDREEADADTIRQGGEVQANKNYYGKKTKAAPAKDASDARVTDGVKGRLDTLQEKPRAPAELAAGRSEGYVTKEEERASERTQLQAAPAATRSSEAQTITAAPAEKAERSVAAGAPAPAAPAPVFAAKKRSAAPGVAQPSTGAEAETKRDAASMANADEAPAAKPRSFSLDDTNAKLKKQSAAEEEKTEMEKLWKEYEKDPKAFNKDKNRSARLRTLLARHDTKSRAKRMRTVPAK